MSKVTSQQQASWDEIVSKNYADQAIWFLNGFWNELEGEAENLWHFAELFAELDTEKKADGSELDEFWSHKFLERLGETLTVIALRERMKTIDVDFNKKMSMIEYLIFRYKKTIQQVIDAPQGENKEEIEAAQAKVEAAQKAVDEMLQKLEEQKAATEAAKAAADEAKRTAAVADAAAAEATAKEEAAKEAAEKARLAAEEADKVAAPYRAAVAENEAALAELRAQEEAYNGKIAELEKKSQEGGVVQRNRAANELQQLKAEDPLPLRRAKINQQATVRKMEKAAAPFNEASEKANAAAQAADEAAKEASAAADVAREEKARADAAAQAAEEAAQAAEEAKRQVEAAVAEAEASLKEAVEFLEATKKKGGIAHGAIWWMERTIEEKKKYLPGYKGKKN